jgi:predicted nucleotidyltransferase
MLEELFGSRARVIILKTFLLDLERDFYQREISTITNLPIRAVQRELERLEKIGLVEKQIRGNRKYYRCRRDFPIFEELKSIILKTVALGNVLKDYLQKKKEKIELAFIYGSFAKGEENISSDIDLLIVGNITSKEASMLLSPAKNSLRREINFVVYDEKELLKKKESYFLKQVLKEPKIFLVGNEGDIKRILKSRKVG